MADVAHGPVARDAQGRIKTATVEDREVLEDILRVLRKINLRLSVLVRMDPDEEE